MGDAFQKGGIKAAFNFPGFHIHELFALLGGTTISTNEKIAYETAWGFSQAGQPALVTFKNVGLNDAADPFINSYFTGVGAGLVVVVFDDIELEGSQAILDSRNYWYHAGGLWLEPFDWNSACLLAEAAPKISEVFNIPVVVRLTNASLRFNKAGGKTLNLSTAETVALAQKYAADFSRLPQVPLVHPAYGDEQRTVLARKNRAIADFVQDLHDRINPQGITGEVSMGYAAPQATSHIVSLPLPMARDIFAVYEVGDAVAARELRLQTSSSTLQSTTIGYSAANKSRVIIAERYERLFQLLKPRFAYIAGDLGEYTMDTLNTLTQCLCFGSSIAVSMGMRMAGGNALAVTGDGSFYHSAKNCLDEARDRNVSLRIVLLDNGGMQGTGGQQVPGALPENSTILTCKLSSVSDQELAVVVQKFCEIDGTAILRIIIE